MLQCTFGQLILFAAALGRKGYEDDQEMEQRMKESKQGGSARRTSEAPLRPSKKFSEMTSAEYQQYMRSVEGIG